MDNSFNTNDSYNMSDYYENPEQVAHEVEQLNGTEKPDSEFYEDNNNFQESNVEIYTGEMEVHINDEIDNSLIRNTDQEEDYVGINGTLESNDDYRI